MARTNLLVAIMLLVLVVLCLGLLAQVDTRSRIKEFRSEFDAQPKVPILSGQKLIGPDITTEGYVDETMDEWIIRHLDAEHRYELLKDKTK